VIVVWPVEALVASPLVFGRPTDGAEELQVADVVSRVCCVRVGSGRCECCLVPSAMEALTGVTAIETTGEGFHSALPWR